MIQAYADDMIIFADSEENLQKQINRAKKFFDFANIKLNPAKCEIMAINGSNNDEGIDIDGTLKSYMVKEDFIKYLGVLLGSRRISKKKFMDAKINKINEELDKLEFSGLAFNQMVKVIKCFFTNKLYYLFANMYVPEGVLNRLDIRIRKVVNVFIGVQTIQRSFIYANVRNGGLGILCMVNEYNAYKVNHVANLLSSEDGKKILGGCLNMTGKIAKNQDLVKALEDALGKLNITWCDWDDFKVQRTTWEWKTNEKDDNKSYFNFIDRSSKHKYKGRIENIHKSLISHTRVAFDFENYSRFNTRNLITCLETGVSNFFFRDCKAPLSVGLARFLIKSRAGIQFTPKRKQDILDFGNGLCT
jgi:hypothetical protein